MRNYVADANIIFSALISGKTAYLELVTENQLYLPDYALEELQEYQTLILEKTKQTPIALKEYTLELFKRITVLPNYVIFLRNHLIAFELCKDIDRKDMVYIALALEFDYTLLTRDKPLADGLRSKGFTNIIMLDELFNKMDDPNSIINPE